MPAERAEANKRISSTEMSAVEDASYSPNLTCCSDDSRIGSEVTEGRVTPARLLSVVSPSRTQCVTRLWLDLFFSNNTANADRRRGNHLNIDVIFHVSNIVAATPGFDAIPKLTTETRPKSGSAMTPEKARSSANPSQVAVATSKSSNGTVNEISVRTPMIFNNHVNID